MRKIIYSLCVLAGTLYSSMYPFPGWCYSYEEYLYNNYNYINDIVLADSTLWCAVMGGIIRWNTSDGSYEVYSTDDGILRKDVHCVAVDHDGVLWCGYGLGGGGVTNFDGTIWKSYRQEKVFSIGVDRNNVKWFAGTNISSFDGETWTYYQDIGETWELHIDSSDTKWFGTWFGDLWSFDGETWINHREKYNIYFDWIYDIQSDKGNNIWVASASGLWKFDHTEWTQFNLYEATGYTGCGSVAIDADNNKIIGNYSGLLKFDDHTFVQYFASEGQYINAITEIEIGSEDTIWLGTLEGLLKYTEGSPTRFLVQEPKRFLHWEIAIDHSNVQWLVTGNFGWKSGIIYYGDGVTYSSINLGEYAYNHYLFDIAVDDSNNKWFGFRYGVLKYDGVAFTQYKTSDGLIDDYVVTIASGKNGTIWAGTNFGVSLFNGSAWKSYTEADGLSSNYVRTICVDRDNIVWFGTTNGVSSFDGVTWYRYNEEDGLASRRVYASVVDRDNRKWFGTRNGVSCFDGFSWTTFTEKDGLVYNRVNDVAIDGNNTLWCATNRGLSSYDGVTWKSYTERDGLVSPMVQSLAVDMHGMLWMVNYDKVLSISDLTTNVEGTTSQPCPFVLQPCYPNPFNSSTAITFSIPRSGHVSLVIYSSTGQKVRELIEDTLSSGAHHAIWNGIDDNGTRVSSGMYIARLRHHEYDALQKMVFIK